MNWYDNIDIQVLQAWMKYASLASEKEIRFICAWCAFNHLYNAYDMAQRSATPSEPDRVRNFTKTTEFRLAFESVSKNSKSKSCKISLPISHQWLDRSNCSWRLKNTPAKISGLHTMVEMGLDTYCEVIYAIRCCYIHGERGGNKPKRTTNRIEFGVADEGARFMAQTFCPIVERIVKTVSDRVCVSQKRRAN